MLAMRTCVDCGDPVGGKRCNPCHMRYRRARTKKCETCGTPIRAQCSHCIRHFGQARVARSTPSSAQWLAAVVEEAARVHVRPGAVLSGERTLRPLVARSRAWMRLLAEGYTLSGIGRTSGFHHTTILNVERRLPVFERRLAESEARP
jgi:hypothetical protein